jgi:uncharacterized protein
MALLEKQLVVKRSTIPNSGKGLFTKKPIKKGEYIVEYKGKKTKWKDVKDDDTNGYLYYVNRNFVIDARAATKTLGRYANDARGISRVKGITNNARYVYDNGHVYIEAIKNIPAGSEILVSYGKEYWDIVRHNRKVEAENKN